MMIIIRNSDNVAGAVFAIVDDSHEGRFYWVRLADGNEERWPESDIRKGLMK